MSTDNKPFNSFSCTACSKTFVTERNLVRHQTSCPKREIRPVSNPTNPNVQALEDEIIALRAQVKLLKEERHSDIEWLKRQFFHMVEERKLEGDWVKQNLRTLQDQMFEIAKIPNQTTTTTNFVGDLQLEELSKYIAPAIVAVNHSAEPGSNEFLDDSDCE